MDKGDEFLEFELRLESVFELGMPFQSVVWELIFEFVNLGLWFL